jgi:threonine/homoserine/homoserine lactone efflux protein
MELTQTSHLWLFFLLVFGVIVIPGMDMAYVMASSLVGGKKTGFSAVAGIVTGGMLHVMMGVLGVGLLLKTFPQVFNLMLLAGSSYIAWIGWSVFRGATALGDVKESAPRTLTATFSRAFVTCLLNPKAYVFMLAIFPQFIRKQYGSIVAQAIVMGSIIAITQILVYGAIVMSAAGVRVWLRTSKTGQIRLGQSIGIVLILAALWTGWKAWQLK